MNLHCRIDEVKNSENLQNSSKKTLCQRLSGEFLMPVKHEERGRSTVKVLSVTQMKQQDGQCGAFRRWASSGAEAVMKHLQSNDVKLLLSSAKQGELVIHYAKLHGVSVVECVSPEEMALISKITGVSPCDSLRGEIAETVVATFCQPLLLGSKRCVHVGFASAGAFQPHCLVLCAPVDSVNEQHAAALQEAFTMLQQLFKRVDQGEGGEAERGSQDGAADVCSWCSSATRKQLVIENTSCNGHGVSEQGLETRRGEAETRTAEPNLRGSGNPVCVQTDLRMASNPAWHARALGVAAEGEGTSGEVQEPQARSGQPGDPHENHGRDSLAGSQKNHSSNANGVTACEHLGVGRDLEKTSCDAAPFKHKKSCVSIAQSCSSCLIEAGSVLPVGGYFEILLHYYIRYYAKQLQQSELTAISNVVADALLSVPRTLYSTERNGFNKFYLETTNALRRNEPLPVNEKGLESVYCKYQLIISVLHCVTELLAIDLIISVKRPLQKIEDNDSEDDC
nr:PREDICTED: Bardet-Biedl syndrome 10 protein [Opisthocomus hoazin]